MKSSWKQFAGPVCLPAPVSAYVAVSLLLRLKIDFGWASLFLAAGAILCAATSIALGLTERRTMKKVDEARILDRMRNARSGAAPRNEQKPASSNDESATAKRSH